MNPNFEFVVAPIPMLRCLFRTFSLVTSFADSSTKVLNKDYMFLNLSKNLYDTPDLCSEEKK